MEWNGIMGWNGIMEWKGVEWNGIVEWKTKEQPHDKSYCVGQCPAPGTWQGNSPCMFQSSVMTGDAGNMARKCPSMFQSSAMTAMTEDARNMAEIPSSFPKAL